VATVGVVIPAYNPRPEHLTRSVQSVLSQSFEDWACVIVDDGSSRPVAVDAVDVAPMSILRRENGGVAASRNSGAAVVGGDYLAFLDQDDEWLPAKLEKQIAFMEANDLAMCDTKFEFVENGSERSEGFEDHRGEFARLLTTARMGLSTLVVRRDTFERVGGFDERLRFAPDWELQLRIASLGEQFARVPEVLTSIHLHGENASGDYRAMYREQASILRRYRADPRAPVRAAADEGIKFVRTVHVYRAIDAFRSSRAPGHLVWAGVRAPKTVSRPVVARLLRPKRNN
jgi:glycosyltransferase involved in cell wall biosynthesis